MSKAAFRSLFLAALVIGLAFRLGRLDLRPMHHDEANQAVKFGILLETGEYRYDRTDHHGPTLYYLTLPAAWARAQKTLAALDEQTLRTVPVAFGAGLLLLFLPLAGGLGREAVVLSAFFAALSPALTYYSRFYIQESLFVFFALGFLITLGKYALQPCSGWALAAGVFAGLAYATKETSIIVFAGGSAALASAWISTRQRPGPNAAFGPRPAVIAHVLTGLAAALAIVVVLYSSFLRNPSDILESVRAFREYATRGIDPGLHTHPWYYYLQLLSHSASGGLFWTEAMILILALIGALFALKGLSGNATSDQVDRARLIFARERFWLRYFLIYSLFAAGVLSIIRLKTPWNMLPFYIGFVLLAGSGGAQMLRSIRSGFVRFVVLVVLLAGSFHLGVQNWRANYRYGADSRNPYVYAQTNPDLLRMIKRVHDLASVHPDGRDMLVKVVAGPYEQWPLPWYLRDLTRIGYWTDTAGAGGYEGVPVVIASQENAAQLESVIGDRFQAEFYGLRPEVLLTLYIDRALWERFLRDRIR